jgi:hypothetical protein
MDWGFDPVNPDIDPDFAGFADSSWYDPEEAIGHGSFFDDGLDGPDEYLPYEDYQSQPLYDPEPQHFVASLSPPSSASQGSLDPAYSGETSFDYPAHPDHIHPELAARHDALNMDPDLSLEERFRAFFLSRIFLQRLHAISALPSVFSELSPHDIHARILPMLLHLSRSPSADIADAVLLPIDLSGAEHDSPAAAASVALAPLIGPLSSPAQETLHLKDRLARVIPSIADMLAVEARDAGLRAEAARTHAQDHWAASAALGRPLSQAEVQAADRAADTAEAASDQAKLLLRCFCTHFFLPLLAAIIRAARGTPVGRDQISRAVDAIIAVCEHLSPSDVAEYAIGRITLPMIDAAFGADADALPHEAPETPDSRPAVELLPAFSELIWAALDPIDYPVARFLADVQGPPGLPASREMPSGDELARRLAFAGAGTEAVLDAEDQREDVLAGVIELLSRLAPKLPLIVVRSRVLPVLARLAVGRPIHAHLSSPAAMQIALPAARRDFPSLKVSDNLISPSSPFPLPRSSLLTACGPAGPSQPFTGFGPVTRFAAANPTPIPDGNTLPASTPLPASGPTQLSNNDPSLSRRRWRELGRLETLANRETDRRDLDVLLRGPSSFSMRKEGPDIPSHRTETGIYVRRTAASALGSLAGLFSPVDAERYLSAYIVRLCRDQKFGIRRAAALCLPAVAADCSLEHRISVLAPELESLAADPNPYVSADALLAIGPFLASLEPEPIMRPRRGAGLKRRHTGQLALTNSARGNLRGDKDEEIDERETLFAHAERLSQSPAVCALLLRYCTLAPKTLEAASTVFAFDRDVAYLDEDEVLFVSEDEFSETHDVFTRSELELERFDGILSLTVSTTTSAAAAECLRATEGADVADLGLVMDDDDAAALAAEAGANADDDDAMDDGDGEESITSKSSESSDTDTEQAATGIVERIARSRSAVRSHRAHRSHSERREHPESAYPPGSVSDDVSDGLSGALASSSGEEAPFGEPQSDLSASELVVLALDAPGLFSLAESPVPARRSRPLGRRHNAAAPPVGPSGPGPVATATSSHAGGIPVSARTGSLLRRRRRPRFPKVVLTPPHGSTDPRDNVELVLKAAESFPAVAKALPLEFLWKDHLLPLFSRFALSESPEVRQAAASYLGPLATLIGPARARQLYSLFETLISDRVEPVRYASVCSLPSLLAACDPSFRRRLLPMAPRSVLEAAAMSTHTRVIGLPQVGRGFSPSPETSASGAEFEYRVSHYADPTAGGLQPWRAQRQVADLVRDLTGLLSPQRRWRVVLADYLPILVSLGLRGTAAVRKAAARSLGYLIAACYSDGHAEAEAAALASFRASADVELSLLSNPFSCFVSGTELDEDRLTTASRLALLPGAPDHVALLAKWTSATHSPRLFGAFCASAWADPSASAELPSLPTHDVFSTLVDVVVDNFCSSERFCHRHTGQRILYHAILDLPPHVAAQLLLPHLLHTSRDPIVNVRVGFFRAAFGLRVERAPIAWHPAVTAALEGLPADADRDCRVYASLALRPDEGL